MDHRVCPWWAGYLLVSPLRRLFQNPEEILRQYIGEGMTVLDIGCGMGYFSLPIARLVGDSGRAVCIDLQEKMIHGLMRRARKAGLADRIDARTCRQDSLGMNDLAGKVDFALAFALVHEVPDKGRFFSQVRPVMKRTGRLLIAEPKGHVTGQEFDNAVSIARRTGFEAVQEIGIRRCHAVLLQLRQQ